ncbi:MAG: phosphoribosylamine--glycine ligase [Candidatus Izemoplasmatales bacterium]|jgi:phosphoribosylamine--glycine ligase|nr:phosphoribosylamine--glycine ligase [Candidatus Izemoplasmatales bacterium]MDD4355129.1 phosphoribosylamine--glycine ligase [Candidatus Izemoplasmatales bacterium]MDY0373211.1 phosphoribosylamine--glycine ligase [Candidatus Izemoplasmatales bacterium]
MKVLVLGGGGREHALVAKLRQDDPQVTIYAIPGNPGIARIAECVALPLADLKTIVDFALEKEIDWTFVGGEELLSQGIVDLFSNHQLRIFGPTQAAAQIETSKRFAKELMNRYQIPTARYQCFRVDEPYQAYLKKQTPPYVIKADGLAKGKGVIIAESLEEAVLACDRLLISHSCVVIEEYLSGIEFSLMALVHKDRVIPLEIAQDYKRARDNDQGPNTGGMGAYSPVPLIPKRIVKAAVNSIMIPVVKALSAENIPFTGVLYGGLMWTKTGVKVIEFNARFGDPETEVILPRMKTKLIPTLEKLFSKVPIRLRFSHDVTVGVVLASPGYPGLIQTGIPINLPVADPYCFHMGTKMSSDGLITAGGRVAILVAKDKTLADARREAYLKVSNIPDNPCVYRKDIAKNL